MTDVTPDPAVKPLSSEELKRDADKAGVQADQLTHKATDPHLPASEGGHASEAAGAPD